MEPEPNVPEGYAAVTVEFTDEESEAIAACMTEYAEIWAAHFRDTGFRIVNPKVEKGMQAGGLVEYVERLVDRLKVCKSGDEFRAVINKILSAFAKAYALHNLPVYIFKIALMYEFVDDRTKAKRFYLNFLRAVAEFEPDEIDIFFLNHLRCDLRKLVEEATGKIVELA
jgi:hypothetical protein